MGLQFGVLQSLHDRLPVFPLFPGCLFFDLVPNLFLLFLLLSFVNLSS